MPVINIKIVAGIHPEQDIYKTFDDRGGVIGRAEDCDWVLRDLTRVVSKQHALISYDKGQFWIEDISTNGVLVGLDLVPLGRGNRRTLLSKDQFKIGDFVFQTEQSSEIPVNLLDITQGHSNSELLAILNNSSLDESELKATREEPLVSGQLTPEPDHFYFEHGLPENLNHGSLSLPIGSKAPAQMNALPDDWELSGFFNAADLSTIDIPKQSANTLSDDSFEIRSSHESDLPAKSDDFVPVAPPIPSPFPPPSLPPLNNEHGTGLANSHAELAIEKDADTPLTQLAQSRNHAAGVDDSSRRIYEELGLPPELFGRVASGDFNSDVARIVQTTTSGLMNLLQARTQFKYDTRMSLTQVSARSNNPLKFCIDTGDALELMLVKKKPGYLAPAEAFEEAIQDLQTHQAAFICGLQAALTGVLAELAPDRIEQELKTGMLGKVEMVAHAQAWKLYKERQYLLSQSVVHNFSEVMGKYFSEAYTNYVNASKLDKGK